MKKLIALASVMMLGGCSLLTSYNVMFTTPNESIVDPATDTIDLALSAPALAYVSGVECKGYDALEILPVINSEMEAKNVHNLTLELLEEYPAGTSCEVTVTAYDKITTTSVNNDITLFVLEAPKHEHAAQIEACEDAGGAWNECGSACDESDPFCVQVCVPQCEFSEEELTETAEEVIDEANTEQEA